MTLIFVCFLFLFLYLSLSLFIFLLCSQLETRNKKEWKVWEKRRKFSSYFLQEKFFLLCSQNSRTGWRKGESTGREGLRRTGGETHNISRNTLQFFSSLQNEILPHSFSSSFFGTKRQGKVKRERRIMMMRGILVWSKKDPFANYVASSTSSYILSSLLLSAFCTTRVIFSFIPNTSFPSFISILNLLGDYFLPHNL